jgi:hypothetical protein
VDLHSLQVGAAGLAVDDLVDDRPGEQPQRGDRRSQVVRDGGDEVAAGAVGLVARRLLGGEPVDHRVRLPGEFAELVVDRGADRRRPLALADGDQAVADRLDIVEHRPRDEPGADDGADARGDHDPRHQQRRVRGDDHQRLDNDERDQHRRDDDRHRQRELPGERPGDRPDASDPAAPHAMNR